MVDEEIIQEWIDKADTDFDFARINLEEEKPFFSQICFHFSQSTESQKAYRAAEKIRKFIKGKLK